MLDIVCVANPFPEMEWHCNLNYLLVEVTFQDPWENNTCVITLEYVIILLVPCMRIFSKKPFMVVEEVTQVRGQIGD